MARNDTVFLPPAVRDKSFAVLDNDLLTGLVTLQRLTMPLYGAAEVTSDNRIRYTLIDADYIGYDSLRYGVCDVFCPEVCDSATLYIVVQDQLEELKTATPTAFSPNEDGRNDVFDPLNTYRLQGYVVNAEDLSIGNAIDFTVRSNVTVNGKVLIAAGAPASGWVKKVKKVSNGECAEVTVTVEEAQAVDGQMVRLRSQRPDPIPTFTFQLFLL